VNLPISLLALFDAPPVGTDFGSTESIPPLGYVILLFRVLQTGGLLMIALTAMVVLGPQKPVPERLQRKHLRRLKPFGIAFLVGLASYLTGGMLASLLGG
jgi:hypothetical protein